MDRRAELASWILRMVGKVNCHCVELGSVEAYAVGWSFGRVVVFHRHWARRTILHALLPCPWPLRRWSLARL